MSMSELHSLAKAGLEAWECENSGPNNNGNVKGKRREGRKEGGKAEKGGKEEKGGRGREEKATWSLSSARNCSAMTLAW